MASIHPPATIGAFEITAVTNGRFRENCYVVVHAASGDCLLIDPGSEEGALTEYLDSRSLTPQKIVLTHGHFDHLGAVDPLMTRFGISCEVHEQEGRLIRQASTYAYRFAREALRVPRGLTFFTGAEPLDWNGRSVEVVPTPGHTSGSVALALDDAVVFTGDTLFRERVGPTTYPESDPNAIGGSVATLLERLPPACTVFPGHGRPWSIGEARIWWSALKDCPPARAIF